MAKRVLYLNAKHMDKQQTQAPLKCAICDSTAAGIYYKVLACDGCRSFFRRMVNKGQSGDVCRDNRTIAECRENSNCKMCRFALCMRAGMRPWYLREARDTVVYFPFPLEIPSSIHSLSVERRIAALLQADIAHENMRLSKYESTHDRILTLKSLLSSSEFSPSDAQHFASTSIIDTASLRKKDMLSTDLECAIEYIQSFAFFPSLSIESKTAILLKSALILTNFAYSFSYFFKGSSRRDEISYRTDLRPIEVMHRIALSVQEASIVKALIVCNPAIEGIDIADLPVLQAENEEYGKMLFTILRTNRGSAAPVIFVEIIALFHILVKQAQAQKGLRLLLGILGQEKSPCPLLDDVMMS